MEEVGRGLLVEYSILSEKIASTSMPLECTGTLNIETDRNVRYSQSLEDYEVGIPYFWFSMFQTKHTVRVTGYLIKNSRLHWMRQTLFITRGTIKWYESNSRVMYLNKKLCGKGKVCIFLRQRQWSTCRSTMLSEKSRSFLVRMNRCLTSSSIRATKNDHSPNYIVRDV